jgi:tRNA U34 5-carboxymethylaminomethyl modifying GTPase MnmE/TrmE
MFSKSGSSSANAYLRFLQKAKTIQKLPYGPLLDANEKALLEEVVLNWFEKKPMTVREAINLSALGSPATLHKRITRLRQRDFLVAFNQQDDKRAKFLIPTQKTLSMFGDFGKKMNSALTSPV